MSQQHNLLPQHSERSFRRYEQYIIAIVRNYPRAIAFKPVAVAPVTFACRLRDAMTSFKTHCWVSELDHEKFCELHPSIVVSQRGETVVVGTKDSLATKDEKAIATAVAQPLMSLNVDEVPLIMLNLTDDENDLLCRLADNRALRRPLRITISSPETAQLFESRYDIALDPLDTPTHYLLI